MNDSSSSEDESSTDPLIRCDRPPRSVSATKQLSPYVTMIFGFVLLWQSIFKIANVAVDLLLKFLWLICLEGPFISKEQIAPECFPVSLSKAQKMLRINGDDFEKLVSCWKCRTLYKFDECIHKER